MSRVSSRGRRGCEPSRRPPYTVRCGWARVWAETLGCNPQSVKHTYIVCCGVSFCGFAAVIGVPFNCIPAPLCMACRCLACQAELVLGKPNTSPQHALHIQHALVCW